MDRTILEVEFEKFVDVAKRLPVPVEAFSLCVDDDAGGGRDVWLVYEQLEKAA